MTRGAGADDPARPHTRSCTAAASSSSVSDPLEDLSGGSSDSGVATTASSATWSFWGQSSQQSNSAAAGSARYRELLAAAELERQLLRLELQSVEKAWAEEHGMQHIHLSPPHRSAAARMPQYLAIEYARARAE